MRQIHVAYTQHKPDAVSFTLQFPCLFSWTITISTKMMWLCFKSCLSWFILISRCWLHSEIISLDFVFLVLYIGFHSVARVHWIHMISNNYFEVLSAGEHKISNFMQKLNFSIILICSLASEAPLHRIFPHFPVNMFFLIQCFRTIYICLLFLNFPSIENRYFPHIISWLWFSLFQLLPINLPTLFYPDPPPFWRSIENKRF